ncbi:MAG: hypothetical protein GY773_01840, partial [Actinomycetia bacterium]|nr:hypothetical protein [Actinomycetes bacterium]
GAPLVGGHTVKDTETKFGRLTWFGYPSDSLVWSLKAEGTQANMNGHSGEIYGLLAPAFEPDDGALDWRRSSSDVLMDSFGILVKPDPGLDKESTNVTFTLDKVLASGSTVSAILGRTDFDHTLSTDLDTQAVPVFLADQDEEYEEISAELRYASRGGEKVDYLIGGYYHDGETRSDIHSFFGPGALGP